MLIIDGIIMILESEEAPNLPPAHPSIPCYVRKPMIHRAKDSLMATSNDLKPIFPEELPADNALAATPPNVPAGEGTSPAVLDPEDGAVGGLPDSEEYEQILGELRSART
ncbi:hypothetical protein PV761_24215, partial [Arthrobacter sp. CC3]